MIATLLKFGVVTAVAASTLSAQGTVPGWYTETRVTSKAVGERAPSVPAPAAYTMRTWATKTAARVEGGIQVPGGANDAYLISRPAEHRGYQVIPSQRSIRVLDNRAIQAMSPVGLRMADSAGVTIKELGDGGMILGHKTSKRQVTIELRVPGRPAAGGAPSMMSVQTMWVASDKSDPMVAAYLAEGKPPATIAGKTMPRGMVLRTESRSTSRSGYDMLRTHEVVAWRREQVAPSLFTLPAGYARVDAAAELGKMKAASDELLRLAKSSDPRDRARARQLGDSMFKVMKIDETARRYNARNDPRAVTITDTALRPKRP